MDQLEDLQKLELLSAVSQREFYKGDSAVVHIVTEVKRKLFNRFGEFQVDGEYCDVVIKSSDNSTFKVSIFNDIFHFFCC